MRASGRSILFTTRIDRQAARERLSQHEPRLRQRALRGVDQQQHAVDHRQAALDLAAEVGVPRRVDDVDLHVAEADGGVLRQDRDPALALEAGIHHPVDPLLVGRERPRLAQERVDQRRLAVVDVGDDRHVADVGSGLELLGHVVFIQQQAPPHPRSQRRQPPVRLRAPRAVRASNLSRHPGSVIERSPVRALQAAGSSRPPWDGTGAASGLPRAGEQTTARGSR